jgi:hypothetical protein
MSGPIATWSIPESWSVGQGERDGKAIFTRFNMGLRPVIGHPSFGKQVGVAVPLNHPTADGLPTSSETDELNAIEDELAAKLTSANESLFAGVVTTSGMREFVFYTSDASGAVQKATEVAAGIHHHKLQIVTHEDPQWENFKTLAPRK